MTGVGREVYRGDTFVGWVLGGKNNLGGGVVRGIDKMGQQVYNNREIIKEIEND